MLLTLRFSQMNEIQIVSIKGKIMAKNFQDDSREEAMRELFDLYKDENEGRGGIDAHLELDGQAIPFELKTTSNGSVTTVRDFGPDHIKKWKDKHWLIGFFVDGREYYHYGSPSMMAGWIEEKEQYISPDFMLAELASEKLTMNDLHEVMEEKALYTLKDARSLQKKQYLNDKYIELQDLEGGYSPEKMLEILKDRSRYLVERGSTLNNPHIPKNYFKDWTEITENHAEILKGMVKAYYDE
jgi:hypothetical protein